MADSLKPLAAVVTSQAPDRLPPQAIEAEQSVLGALMIDREAMHRISDVLLDPKMFYRGSHQTIYGVVLELFTKNEALDLLTIKNRLHELNKLEEIGGASYLTTLVNSVGTAANIGHYAKIVRKKHTLRQLISTSHDIASRAFEETEDVDVLLDEVEQNIFRISQQSIAQEFAPIRSQLTDAFERIDRLHKGDGALRGIPTGFSDLDNLLAGLQKSDLVVLAARPSFGKTSLALDIALHTAVHEHVPVGIFSLEMSRDSLVDRLIAAEARVDGWKLRTGRLTHGGPDSDFDRIRAAFDVLAEAPIFVDDNASINVLQMKTMSRRLQAEHGLGLLIVDYLQLIQPLKPSDSMVQQVTEISRSLKGLARELNVPILAISQLSRAVEQRHPPVPRLSDLRESGCLAGETLVMRADTGALVPIRDLVGETNIPVYSLDDAWQLQVKNISRVFSSGHKQLFELKTLSGRTIRASANHPFRTLAGWRRLDELARDESIALPRELSPRQARSSLNDDELVLLAHLIGDGCVLPRQPIHYTSADRENLTAVQEAARRLFGISPRLVPQKNWWHAYLPSPYHLTHRRPHPITKWFAALGLERVRSYEKRLPATLFTCNGRQLQLFLKHLWATDGNISWKKLRGRKPAAAIYYATTSKTLAGQVQHLLLRLGIQSTARNVPQADHRLNYHVHIQGSEMQLKFLRLVGAHGKRGLLVPKLIRALETIEPNPNRDIIPVAAWQLFITPAKVSAGQSWRDLAANLEMSYCGSALFKSGLSRERMERVASALESDTLRVLARSQVYWDEIESITPLGIEEVFDATVPGTHNFVANDFIVHNSIEQDSDVVLFIYREDRYKESSNKKNLAEIIVAKHRNGPIGRVELYFNEQQTSFKNLAKEETGEFAGEPLTE
ncbi:replicative DNA helicase [Candidatus Parcubacteria bacterium]|nr:replicative DNA helicase [Candidatus Parcubacteria bacterium]